MKKESLNNSYENKMLEAFVDKPNDPEKIIWYKKAFSKFQNNESKFKWSWSWWAFFMGPWFLFYRKLYLAGFIYLIIAPFGNLLLGAHSSSLLYKRFEKKRRKIEESWQDEEQRLVAMQKIGGHSNVPLLILGIVLLGILTSVAIPKLAPTSHMANVPKCSDPQTVKLVKKIISENQLFASMINKNKMEDMNLDMIRTVKQDKETDIYTCKAKLDLGQTTKINPILNYAFSNITYTVALTDDKKQFVVEILSE